VREAVGNGLRLVSPIEVVVEPSGSGEWVASHARFLAHGVGGHPEAAVDDFLVMLFGLYWHLAERELKLAPHLQLEFADLREVLRRT
jgi:hypothetical protein